tara:strand:- start:1026 stop:1460 length:435 start_codon:yes stop_codon:yes gene_type:complete
MKLSFDTIENKMMNIFGERGFSYKFAKKIKEYEVKEVLSMEHYLNSILSGMDDFADIQFIKLGAELKDPYLESMLIPATFDRSPGEALRKAYMTQAHGLLSYMSINIKFNTITFQGHLSGLCNETGSNDSLTLEMQIVTKKERV